MEQSDFLRAILEDWARRLGLYEIWQEILAAAER